MEITIEGREARFTRSRFEIKNNIPNSTRPSNKYKNCDIYLGEILFHFPEEIDSRHKKFYDYTRLYKILADGLNSISDSKFKVLSKCLTYQDLFKSFKLDEAVRRFYSL